MTVWLNRQEHQWHTRLHLVCHVSFSPLFDVVWNLSLNRSTATRKLFFNNLDFETVIRSSNWSQLSFLLVWQVIGWRDWSFVGFRQEKNPLRLHNTLKIDSILACVCFTNRFQVVVRLFSNRSQMTTKVAHEAQASVSLMFLPHFDVLCDLVLNRRTATWNLFVLYNKELKKV